MSSKLKKPIDCWVWISACLKEEQRFFPICHQEDKERSFILCITWHLKLEICHNVTDRLPVITLTDFDTGQSENIKKIRIELLALGMSQLLFLFRLTIFVAHFTTPLEGIKQRNVWAQKLFSFTSDEIPGGIQRQYRHKGLFLGLKYFNTSEFYET